MTTQEPDPKTMRTALYDGFGAPDVLYIGQIPKPTPSRGQVLIKVHAISVNSIDVLMRGGTSKIASWIVDRGFPKSTGKDYSGHVVELGSGATGVAVGDAVWGQLPAGGGSAAEYIVARPGDFASVPAGLDLTEAAALPCVAATALAVLQDSARLQPGQRLLVRGASGGVGSAAVQIGRVMGAHVVGLASGKNLDLVRELGAHEALDYSITTLGDLGQFDVIFDTVGTGLRPFRDLLGPTGRIYSVAVTREVVTSLFGRRHTRQVVASPHRPVFERLGHLVDEGAIRPVVDSIFPLSEIAAAHQKAQSGGVRGKVVVRIA